MGRSEGITIQTTEVDKDVSPDVAEGLLKQRYGRDVDNVVQVGFNSVTGNPQFVHGRCNDCQRITHALPSYSYKGITVTFRCHNHTKVPTWDKRWKLPETEQFYPVEGANIAYLSALIDAPPGEKQ